MNFKNVCKDSLAMLAMFPENISAPSEQENRWRYYAMATQNRLKNVLAGLYDRLENINVDGDLTDPGKLRRFAEEGRIALTAIDGIEQGSGWDLYRKLIDRHVKLEAEMLSVAKEDNVHDVLREIEMRGLVLKQYAESDLLGVLEKAVKQGDGLMFRAIVNLPKFLLEKYMLTDAIIANARQRWAERQSPQNATEYSEICDILLVLKKNFENVRQNIYTTCNIDDLRRYTEQERQILVSAGLLRGASANPPVSGPGHSANGTPRTDYGTNNFHNASAQPPSSGPMNR